jgi:predicted membrane-bound mannosyltransferase
MPLNDAEAHQALAALRTVNDQVAGSDLVAESPLTFFLNAITFGMGASGNVAARLPVALGGVLLTLSPVLWRRYLNPLPPLIISLLLAISPVMLLASRAMSPVIWTMLLAVVAAWLVLRFVESREPRWGVAATAALAAMVFLAEPAGLLVLLAMAFGVFSRG